MRGTDWRVLPVAANGQPTLAAHVRAQDGGAYHARTLQVFTVVEAGISHIVVFADPNLFRTFGLAAVVDARSIASPERR